MSEEYSISTVSLVLPYQSKGKDGFVYVKTSKDRLWGLPAGKLDIFKNDKDETVREVWEETGLDIVVTHFLGLQDFKSNGGRSINNRSYLGKVVGGDFEISRPREILELGVFSLGEIRKFCESGNLRPHQANLRPVEIFFRGELYSLSVVSSF